MLVEMYAVRLLWGLMGRNYNQFQLDAKIEFNCHVIKDLIESISRHNSLAFFFSEHFVIFLSLFGLFFYSFRIFIRILNLRDSFVFPPSL